MYHAEAHRGISTLVLMPMSIHIKCSIAQLPSCSMLKHSHFIMFFFGLGNKSATGLMEWADEDTALDAFVLTNHQTAMSKSES